MDYDGALEKFKVHVDASDSRSAESIMLARMHICFQAEDPFVFCERVVRNLPTNMRWHSHSHSLLH